VVVSTLCCAPNAEVAAGSSEMLITWYGAETVT
jgi:hypothetical protein